MIDREIPHTRRVSGVMTAAALFCSLCIGLPANAAEISLSDLRGYSIDAEWVTNRNYTWVETSGQRKRIRGSFRYVHKIYISKTGRLFHRRHMYDPNISRTKPIWTYDHIRSGRGERLEWGPNSTFIHRGIPSDAKERTTYARIVRLALSQSGGSYSCSVAFSLALKKGEKQYINYEPSGRYRIVHSVKARQKSCRVYKGNVFKGEVRP